MKRSVFWGLLIVSLMSMGSALSAQTELSDDELLKALDDVRFIDSTSLTFTSDIVAQRTDGEEKASVQLYFKEIDGEDFSRVEFLSPPEEVGNVYLTTPDGTYFSTPDLVEPLLISGAQSVFGDATVVQTVGIPLANDYTIVSRELVTAEDGSELLEVQLEGVDSEVTFPTATILADPETLEVRFMTVFALSGDAVNQVTFESYAELENGDLYAERQLIQSELIPENQTLLTINNIDTSELSDDLFDPDQL